jgi:hypothetical protein
MRGEYKQQANEMMASSLAPAQQTTQGAQVVLALGGRVAVLGHVVLGRRLHVFGRVIGRVSGVLSSAEIAVRIAVVAVES